MSRRHAALAAILVVLVATPRTAPSHTGGTTGFAAIRIEDSTIRYRMTLWPDALPSAVGDEVRHRP